MSGNCTATRVAYNIMSGQLLSCSLGKAAVVQSFLEVQYRRCSQCLSPELGWIVLLNLLHDCSNAICSQTDALLITFVGCLMVPLLHSLLLRVLVVPWLFVRVCMYLPT